MDLRSASAFKNILVVKSYLCILAVASREGKGESNVAVKVMIEEWVFTKKATGFTFGRVQTKRIENKDCLFENI